MMLNRYKSFVLPSLLLGSVLLNGLNQAHAACNSAEVTALKQTIIQTAMSFKGQADPDHSRQNKLEPLVQQLVSLCPQPSIKERLPLLAGPWQQIWGPYTYRNNSRGIDPRLDPDHIYQVVFPGGYYYNVSPERDGNGNPKSSSSLLRGEYEVDAKQANRLNIHFTHLKAVKGTPPAGHQYIDLPALSEAKELKQSTLLPSVFVRLFFGGGFLQEVYTDSDLRITYGTGRKNTLTNYLYILQRVKP